MADAQPARSPSQAPDSGEDSHLGALHGVRVLDFAQYVPGAYAAALLADMGADVIRIDRAPPGPAIEPARIHQSVSRGKRSLAIDLKHPAALGVAMRLIEQSDVLIEGFRPGVMERLGLGPEVALAHNSRLVYARLTGWGQEGPLARRAGHDINYLAISGALGATGQRGRPATPPIPPFADFAGGSLMCAFAIVSSLLWRERSGRGQVVDAGMTDGVVAMLGPFLAAAAAGDWGPRGTNLLDGGAPFYDVYETADGRYVSVGAIEPKFYAVLIAGLGLSAQDLPAQMDRSSWPVLRNRLADAFRRKTLEEWSDTFRDTDACVFPVLGLSEAPSHPHNVARAALHGMPADGQPPSVSALLSASPGAVGGPAPRPGEHTRSVLGDAGLDDGAVRQLIADGVVAVSG